jgi:hypothetical protein
MMETSRGRLLFLSTSIPPLPESQTIRNVYFLRGLAARGYDIDVVAPPAEGGDGTLFDLLPSGVRVLRTREPAYERIQRLVARVSLRSLRPVARSAVATAAGMLCAPDVRRDWARLAIRTALEQAQRPSGIVSSSGSAAAHLAAAELARDWRIPWVAELGDPWSFNPIRPASLPHIRWQNGRLERRAFAGVSALVVTTEETAAVYRARWPSLPVRVVPCGYSKPARGGTVAPGARGVSIAYVGSASRGTRDLRVFLAALSKLPRECNGGTLGFQVIGSHSPAFVRAARKLGLDNVTFSGWVGYWKSIELMHQADLLLLYGNADPLQVPGKVFNYMASNRPILYLGQLPPEKDPTHRLLSGLPGVICTTTNDPALPDLLHATLANLDQYSIEALRRMDDPGLTRYHWDELGRYFASVVENALNVKSD